MYFIDRRCLLGLLFCWVGGEKKNLIKVNGSQARGSDVPNYVFLFKMMYSLDFFAKYAC